eukprot:scaffold1136_cov146-Cylindrotheca_fusiformis.AAC.17
MMISIDDEERTRGLAEVCCFQKTAGNPFLLIEFMGDASRRKAHFIQPRPLEMSTDNVVDLLQGRVRKMPANVQLLLQYAACLGSSFNACLLDPIWREQSVMGTGDQSCVEGCARA